MAPGSNDLKTKLSEWFKKANAWDQKTIARKGNIVINIVKLPSKTTRRGVTYPTRLALHIKPADAFKGMILDRSEEIIQLVELITEKAEKLKELAKIIAEINAETPPEEEVEFSL